MEVTMESAKVIGTSEHEQELLYYTSFCAMVAMPCSFFLNAPFTLPSSAHLLSC